MANAQSANLSTPAALGFSMPAEWVQHEATWLGWPHNATDWPGKFAAIPWVYGEMARAISPGETVCILVRHRAGENAARRILGRVGCDLKKIRFIVHPTNRSWTRDSGPIFVKRPSSPSLSHRMGEGVRRPGEGKPETAIVHFHFNGWARYPDWRKDTKVPETAARVLRKPLFHAKCVSIKNSKPKTQNFVLEGGGIEVNGHGTLLTTEECYLDPKIQVRNPGLEKSEFETALKNYLGVRNVFWLARGPAGDDTHGHIDDICRFVSPRTLVLVREKNSKDVNYRPLAENWERIHELRLEDGSKPEVVALPMPAPLYFDRVRLPASYANFYIGNAAVIVPTFNDPNDRLALGILGELFKDRPVVGIHAVDLVLGRGTLHCLTQQQPAEV